MHQWREEMASNFYCKIEMIGPALETVLSAFRYFVYFNPTLYFLCGSGSEKSKIERLYLIKRLLIKVERKMRTIYSTRNITVPDGGEKNW